MRKLFALLVLAGLTYVTQATKGKQFTAECDFNSNSSTTGGADENVGGKIKFTQEEGENTTKINIKLKGLRKNKKYAVMLHENGDTSKKCKKIGAVF